MSTQEDIKVLAAAVGAHNDLLMGLLKTTGCQSTVNASVLPAIKFLLEENKALKKRIERLESWSNN